MVPIPNISAGGGTSKSGDAASELTGAFQYNAAFNVGGSGSTSQSQAADSGAGAAGNTNSLIYIMLAGFALLLILEIRRK